MFRTTFLAHCDEIDEVDREANIALSTAGVPDCCRQACFGEGLSYPRLRGGVHHAFVVPSFGASQEVKRECGSARDRPKPLLPPQL
jgi:hypothetical protein